MYHVFVITCMSMLFSDCIPDPCYGPGDCINTVRGYTCNCGFGYTGPQCLSGTLVYRYGFIIMIYGM